MEEISERESRGGTRSDLRNNLLAARENLGRSRIFVGREVVSFLLGECSDVSKSAAGVEFILPNDRVTGDVVDVTIREGRVVEKCRERSPGRGGLYNASCPS